MVRSTKRNSNKDVDRPPHDRREETVEPLMDDDEVVVDGFQRLSVLGLEVMTLDGPFRVRTLGKTGRRTSETIDADSRPATRDADLGPQYTHGVHETTRREERSPTEACPETLAGTCCVREKLL